MTVPAIPLNNGALIPQLGLGTYLVKPEETYETVRRALDLGYRHIDTAQMYGNETQVGEAVRASGINRSEIFVTSKLSNAHHDYDDALRAFDMTLDALNIDYLDLFLVHWPMPRKGDFVETWQAMEKMYSTDKVKAIGVSNFQPDHLRRLERETDMVPAVNQIEVHPFFAQNDVRAANAEMGIATEAWSPIAQGKVTSDETICQIADSKSRSAAQVTLRWHIQRGDIVFPKSTTPERMAENFQVFDFELSDAEMASIDALDRNERMGPHPDNFNLIPK